jgi:hypothetical protein
MKRWICLLLVLITAALSGCSGISRAEYDEMASRLEALTQENEELQAQLKARDELYVSEIYDINNISGTSVVKTVTVDQRGLQVDSIVVAEWDYWRTDIAFKINYLNADGGVIGSTNVAWELTVGEVGQKEHQFTTQCELAKAELVSAVQIQWINAD